MKNEEWFNLSEEEFDKRLKEMEEWRDWMLEKCDEDWIYVEKIFDEVKEKLYSIDDSVSWEGLSFSDLVCECDRIRYSDECVEELRYYCEELIYGEGIFD